MLTRSTIYTNVLTGPQNIGPTGLLNWAELSLELGRSILVRDFIGPICLVRVVFGPSCTAPLHIRLNHRRGTKCWRLGFFVCFFVSFCAILVVLVVSERRASACLIMLSAK